MTRHLDMGTLEIAELQDLADVSDNPLTLQAVGKLASQEVEVDLGKPSRDEISKVTEQLAHLGKYGLLGAA